MPSKNSGALARKMENFVCETHANVNVNVNANQFGRIPYASLPIPYSSCVGGEQRAQATPQHVKSLNARKCRARDILSARVERATLVRHFDLFFFFASRRLGLNITKHSTTDGLGNVLKV